MFGAIFASILVTFPAEGQVLPPTPCTYVIGAAETNRRERLYLNGVGVDVYRTGAFLAMAAVRTGKNSLKFVQGTNELVRTFTVKAPQPPAAETPKKPPRDPYADLNIPRDAEYPSKPAKGTPPGKILVMVDAGHGGKDSGALSPRGFKEKDFNIAVAKRVAELLQDAGFRVEMTRTDDTFKPLYDRPRSAFQKKADAFISIHHNATGVGRDPRDARHSVTYASNEKGLALARSIQKRLAPAVAPVPDKGAEIKSLAVCRNPAVPSCLVEVDFINLPEGEEASMDPGRREKVAQAIVEGFGDWLEE